MEGHSILFVDDEVNILSSLKRLFLTESGLKVFTASSGAEGLRILEQNSINLVVADQKMPHMNGADFLKEVKAKYPDTLRMMLTGYVEISSATEAINKGEVYRFLTKPWNDDELRLIVRKGLEFADLKRTNRKMNELIKKKNKELKLLNTDLEEKVKQRTAQLEKVVNGLKSMAETLKQNFRDMVDLVTGIISLFQKELGSHSKRVAELTTKLCEAMEFDKDKSGIILSAAFLHDIGLVGADKEIFIKDIDQLDEESQEMYYQHPAVGASLIGSVKYLKKVSEIIRSHHEEFNGTGFPDGLRGSLIPEGARVIKIANDYDNLIVKAGRTPEEAIHLIERGSYESYDPKIASRFAKVIRSSIKWLYGTLVKVKLEDIRSGMYLFEDVLLTNGVLFLPKGIVISEDIIQKISKLSPMLDMEREVEVRY